MSEESKQPSNYLITPPDILNNELETFLIVNATEEELNAFSKFLPWARKTYNFYLYNHSMSEPVWFSLTASRSTNILVSRHLTKTSFLEPILDHISKIVWFGKDQTFTSPTEFLAAYERNTSK